MIDQTAIKEEVSQIKKALKDITKRVDKIDNHLKKGDIN